MALHRPEIARPRATLGLFIISKVRRYCFFDGFRLGAVFFRADPAALGAAPAALSPRASKRSSFVLIRASCAASASADLAAPCENGRDENDAARAPPCVGAPLSLRPITNLFVMGLRARKQSLQYTGLSSLGLKGTSHCFPQVAQTALNIRRGPSPPCVFLPPPENFIVSDMIMR